MGVRVLRTALEYRLKRERPRNEEQGGLVRYYMIRTEGRTGKKSKKKGCWLVEEIRDFSSISPCKMEVMLEEEEEEEEYTDVWEVCGH